MLTVSSRARATIQQEPTGRRRVESDGKALSVSGRVVEHMPVGRLLVSDEVIGFEIERSRLLAHESEREPERPGSDQMPGLLLQLGLAEGPSQTFEAKPPEPADGHGGLPPPSLRDPYPRIPELYYG